MVYSLLILAFSYLFVLVSAQPWGKEISYTPLNLDEATKDPAIGEIFSFGLQWVIEKGVEQDRLIPGEYTVAEFYEIGEYTDGFSSYYKFSVAITDPLKKKTAITFGVWNGTLLGQRAITSYYIEDQDPYNTLNVDQSASDPYILEIINFAGNYIYEQGQREGYLFAETYYTKVIYYIGQYTNDTGSSYKFGMTWSSTSDPVVVVIFTVWDPTFGTGERQVTSLKIGGFPVVGVDPVTQPPAPGEEEEEEEEDGGEGEEENGEGEEEEDGGEGEEGDGNGGEGEEEEDGGEGEGESGGGSEENEFDPDSLADF